MKNYLLTIAIILVFASNIDAQWVNTTSGTANTLRDVYFFDAENGIVIGDNATMQITSNGGNSWTPFNIITQPQLSSEDFNAIDFLGNNGVVVGSLNTFTCIKTNDSGATWTVANLVNAAVLNNVVFANANTIFSCGDDGKIFKSNNTGDTWAELNSNLTNDLKSIFFLDDNTGFVVGDNGTAIKTTDGGNNWSTLYNQGDTINFTAVQFVSADTGFIVGSTTSDQSYLIATYNGGNTWLPPLNMQVKKLNDMFFVNDNVGYVVGGEPTQGTNSQYIAKTTDAGFTWQQQVESNPKQLQAVYFVDALNGFAVGDGGTIIKTTTGGGITGVAEKENKMLATIYPNPVQQEIYIALQKSDEANISVFDLQGKLKLQEKIYHQTNHSLSLNHLPIGMYIIQIQQAEEIWFGKIIKE